MRRLVPALGLWLGACQSFGAFSQPTTLPAHAIRVGASGIYDHFQVSDERITNGDLAVTAGFGISDSTELDFLVSGSTLDARFKHALITPGVLALALEGGVGVFTAYSENTSAGYVPVALVAGLRPGTDITIFAGPQVWGALSFDPPGRGAGFDRGNFGLLVGGVGGIALESSTFTFCPQLTVLTPVGTGASGTIFQLSFGAGVRTR